MKNFQELYKELYKAFGGKLHGSRKMKQMVCRTLAMMPEEIIDHITSDCWFFSSTEDAWAFTIRGDELIGKHLIFLGEDLLREPDSQIMYTIAHEIGHVILGHRNSILVSQTPREVRKQESEAHEFAKHYLQ